MIDDATRGGRPGGGARSGTHSGWYDPYTGRWLGELVLAPSDTEGLPVRVHRLAVFDGESWGLFGPAVVEQPEGSRRAVDTQREEIARGALACGFTGEDACWLVGVSRAHVRQGLELLNAAPVRLMAHQPAGAALAQGRTRASLPATTGSDDGSRGTGDRTGDSNDA